MTVKAIVVAAFMTVSAAGCRSVPVHYYSLAQPTQLATGLRAVPQVTVRVVKIPAAADRLQLVEHRGAEIAILDDRQWIAPLISEIETALSLELNKRLGEISRGDNDRVSPNLAIQVNVTQFEAYPHDRVFIAASWQVASKADSARKFSCASELTESIHPGVAAVIDGFRTIVSRLANQIADSIVSEAGCQELGLR
jgi:uncharacterized lipoprotein YmbA